eukprot:61585_1
MIKNKMNDGKIRYRSFLSFFIIDPLKKTNITTNIYSTLKREDYAAIIIKYGCNECPMDIAINICEFGLLGLTLNEAKEIREKDIEIRKNTYAKGKWGICWGNGGVSKTWYDNGEANAYAMAMEWESTTHSEL